MTDTRTNVSDRLADALKALDGSLAKMAQSVSDNGFQYEQNKAHLIEIFKFARRALTAHEAAKAESYSIGENCTARLKDCHRARICYRDNSKAATPDDVREAFEAAYRTGDPLIDDKSLSRDFDGVYEAALTCLCFKWFGLGHNTALDALERLYNGIPWQLDQNDADYQMLRTAPKCDALVKVLE